jgi:sec-independent protein translocase protein TatA
MPGGSEMLIVLLVVFFLFGGSRLPQLAKGMGQSIKEFKKGMSQGGDDELEVASRRRGLRAAETTSFGDGVIARDRDAVGEWR